MPPECAANNCGYLANLSGAPIITAATQTASLEERKLEIPTTTNIPLHLYVYTPAACLQSSRSLVFQRLQRISRAPNLCAPSTSLHVQHASRAPDLHASFEATPASHLQSSRASYVYASYASLHHVQSSRPLYTS